jgi:hypothetical protein
MYTWRSFVSLMLFRARRSRQLPCEPAAGVGGRRARLSRSAEVGRTDDALSRGRRRAVRRGAERLGPVTGSVA